jgi:hypothetical protein
MKYLLGATIVFWLFTAWMAKTNSHSVDDFVGSFYTWVFGAVSAILTFIYIAFVFWYHTFW